MFKLRDLKNLIFDPKTDLHFGLWVSYSLLSKTPKKSAVAQIRFFTNNLPIDNNNSLL